MITYTDNNFVDVLIGGEVFLVHTDLSHADRVDLLKENKFFGLDDVVCISESTIGIEDIAHTIEQIQKRSSGLIKTVFVVFDQMSLPAQNAFLKTLEDIRSDVCIFLYVSKQTTLLSTVVSRVIGVDVQTYVQHESAGVFFTYKELVEEKTVAKKLEMMKSVIKAFDDEVISKQDIISWISRMYMSAQTPEHRAICGEAIVMLQQQSVLVKYVLEYMVSFM